MAEKSKEEGQKSGIVVGVDVGGTKIALMVSDIASGNELACDRIPTPADAGPTPMIEMLCQAILRLVSETGRDRGELRAVGIAFAGQVDAVDGRVIVAGNLKSWVDVPLRSILSRELGVPIWVEQDANAAALGERWRGAAQMMHNFIFLALGTGIGAGVVINGRLHRGYHDAAGEVGNFILGRQHLGRNRRGHGNLEKLVGGPAIRRQAEEVSGKGLSAAETIERADDDERLAKVADRVADYLAITIVNIVALLDPQAIIFGGGTSSAGEDLIDRIRERVEREVAVRPTLMHSVLGEDAQLHGAVFGALWELNPDMALREELR